MLKVSWDVSIQGCHWQPLSIHQSRYMYLLRVVTGQFKYQPLFCLEAEIVRLWFLMTFAGQEFFKHQKCQKKWELTHIKSKKRKKKKKLYSSTYVVTTKVSVYSILGIICGQGSFAVLYSTIFLTSRGNGTAISTCSSESRINRALYNVFYLSYFETLSPGTVPKIELARPPVLAVKRSTDWASLPRFREFTVKIIYPRRVPLVIW